MSNRLSAALCAAACTVLPALAQQNPPELQRIEVTGSHIRRVDGQTLQPVVVLTREEIERSGKTALSEVLRDLPAVSGGTFSEATNAGNSFAPGTAGVSLRGLGVNTTLVLLNGRRLANYGFAQNVSVNFVDLNSIPVHAIERVEVLKDGASAVYGSDAIAGVVNVILRRDFRGGEVRASHGAAQQGGLTHHRAGVTGGLGHLARDRFNVMASLEHLQQDPLGAGQREFSRNPDNRAQGLGGLDFRSPTGQPGYFSAGSVRTAFATCPADRVVAPAALGVSGTGTICAFDYAPDNDLLPSFERTSLLATGTFQLNRDVQLRAELVLNRNQTSLSSSPTPGAFTLGAAHPDKPDPGVTQVAYRFLEAGLRLGTVRSTTQRLLLGARGSLGAWDFDAAVLSSTSRQFSTGFNHIVQERANEAFLGTLAGFGGQYYRVLDPGLNPPGMQAALSISPVRKGDSRLAGADVRASRDLFSLPGGSAAIALGLDRRKEEVADLPDPRTDTRNPARVTVAGLGSTFVQGGRTQTSAFVELSLPFAPGVESQLALRTDDYDDFGRKTTPKLGLSYRLGAGALVRAGYAQGFRAPSMAEMYLGDSVAYQSVVDAVRCFAYRVGPLGPLDARTRAVCGVSAAGVLGTGAVAQVQTTISGNKALEPETARSASFGVVVEPARAWSVALDVYYIEHQNRILQPTAAFVLANLPGAVTRFAPSQDDLAARAPGALRGVGGDTVSGIRQSYFNAARQTTGGVDLEWRYRTAWGAGRLEITSSTTYIDSLRRQTAPGGPMNSIDGSFDHPRVRSTATALWMSGPWATAVGIQYSGSMDDARSVLAVPVKIGAVVTYDLNITHRGIRNLTWAVGGRNITNRNPPFSNLDWYGYAPGTHSPVGAYWYATARYRF